MKATDLMINDLVQVDGVVRISTIRTGAVYDYMNKEYAIGCVKPIPLTPEILEKNGFRKLDFSHYHIQDRTLVLDADGKWGGPLCWHWVVTEMSENSKGQNVVLDYYVATINYVHELQRALRCCGLDDLADNFQID